ncbi:PTS sugar transporter subunit IIB [Caldifermentibacillus hisashii]|uniref:PTS sugar transporter subunit IIB n=1 Tax=Bacillaceae TaxID=186817 RepID=UPI001D05F7C0|nr:MULTISPECIES: PTS sugar transporter subunit IIB [Bacillaceae]MCB5934190.1 PTS sugar transporter subunit IIB [Bacillus sp. DFI.2.34]MCB7075709.1 PTS sugar transporter subunit IIB [Caldibacillus thermoamylovorans]MCM3797465.1 PTS sugar transporter subunit IIB [Caldibacillus thermoamylovorans]MED4852990.1 PTS sugar transporter subunit IIB [Caldifermentibacillus hisashii]
MYRALVCCRAGMGSSMLLKIKADQVISENHFDIKTEHGNLESLRGYNGDLVITMEDLMNEIKDQVPYAVGIRNIVDKEEIKTKLLEFLESKK